MKKLFPVALILLFALSGFSQKKYIIKFATLAPAGSTWGKVMTEFNQAIQDATNGQVKFKIYAGGIQGDEKDVVRKIRLGQLHSGGFTGVGLGEILPEERILDSPMLFRNYAEVDFITNLLFDEFAKKFEKAGYILIGWTEVGFVYVYGKKPIKSLAELKGTKIWMWEGDPISEATFKALEVHAIPLSITDVLTSLQTNLINAVYTSPLACVSLQWNTKVKYMMNFPLADAEGAVLIAKRKFDQIPPEYQKILIEKGHQYMSKLIRLSRKDNEASIKLMQKSGIQIVDVPKQNLQAFLDAGKKARQSLVGKLYSQQLLDKVENALAKFRKQETAR